MVKIGIIGANGYTGFELMRLLAASEKAEIVFAASRSKQGTRIADLYPSLSGIYKDMQFVSPDPEIAAKQCDVVFTALPHAASAEMGAKLLSHGTKVIDLSADFRYNDISLYEKTYNVTHPNKELNGEAVYGLTEIYRDKIRVSRLVANPGCYTTSSILPLLPLIKTGLINTKGIIIDAKSGVSGAGRKADEAYSFTELNENFKAYGVTTHRHTSEIEEQLSFGKEKIELSFTPHLLPVRRGILSTIYAETTANSNEIMSAYIQYYGNEQFVEVLEEGIFPSLNSVVGSNMCKIGFKLDKRLGRIIIVSCLDNLIKGASGQAIQNMNVMFGLPENSGLSKVANHL